MSEPSLPDKVVAIDEELARAKIAHAFGGALALAYYAEPRTTIDVDVNLFIPPKNHDDVFDALRGLGVERPGDSARLVRDGQTRWRWGRTPVDLFFSNDPIHDAMRTAVRRVPFGEHRIPILGPEHLVVCKVLFDRPKDWIDIEQILITEANFDHAEVDRWLEELVPAGPRIARYRELAARGA